MKKIKKGDIVARKSYGMDIIFYVKRIIKLKEKKVAILCGVVERIEADSLVEDLQIVDKRIVKSKVDIEDDKIQERLIKKNKENKIKIIETEQKRLREKIITGKILHLDRR